jgi:hypothetical protein
MDSRHITRAHKERGWTRERARSSAYLFLKARESLWRELFAEFAHRRDDLSLFAFAPALVNILAGGASAAAIWFLSLSLYSPDLVLLSAAD